MDSGDDSRFVFSSWGPSILFFSPEGKVWNVSNFSLLMRKLQILMYGLIFNLPCSCLFMNIYEYFNGKLGGIVVPVAFTLLPSNSGSSCKNLSG